MIYPLPDDLYPDSKDWMAADYAGRVQWLHAMYESKKREVEALHERMNALSGDLSDALKALSDLRVTHGVAAQVVQAAERLVRCKGRYHTEQNFKALAELFGVRSPEPLITNIIELTDAERRALNEFTAELWGRFRTTAMHYLDEQEINVLSDKLEGKR